ncbi:MAG: hypothetical protein AB1563_09815 [Bacillota bacterium]
MAGVGDVRSNKARAMDEDIYAVLRRFARLLATVGIRAACQADCAVSQAKANACIGSVPRAGSDGWVVSSTKGNQRGNARVSAQG